MGFLKVILLIIGVFYLIGWIGRLFLRHWIIKKQKEFQQNGSAGGYTFKQYTWGAGADTTQKSTQREGEIKVEQSGQTQKKVNKQVGDYVDYEEIKE